MSRIQDILQKAERDGTARPLSIDHATAPIAPPPEPAAPLHDRFAVHAESRRRGVPQTLPEIDATGRVGVEAMTDGIAVADYVLDPLLVAGLLPHSLAAERFRSLRTRITNAENGKPYRVLLLTSPNRGEGKSITTTNLGLTMAQEFHRRVAVVDADLRKPRVHTLFGLPHGPGLTDVLVGSATLDEVALSLPEYGLTVIPAGTPTDHPAELLGSAAMRRLLDALRARFDRVVVDTPPAGLLADVGVMAPMADGVLLIIRAGVTPKPAIERALASFDPTKLLGLVLNEVGPTPDADGYYGYGYEKE
jgi:capsular exopolysaccharide synthesis family protein